MNQAPMFLEDQCRYLIQVGNEQFECWRICNKWIADNASYSVIDDEKVTVLERKGTPDEVFV